MNFGVGPELYYASGFGLNTTLEAHWRLLVPEVQVPCGSYGGAELSKGLVYTPSFEPVRDFSVVLPSDFSLLSPVWEIEQTLLLLHSGLQYVSLWTLQLPKFEFL